MPSRSSKTERVVVVRTDTDGNVLSYDVVDQPVQQEQISSTYRSKPVQQEQIPSVYRSQPVQEEQIPSVYRSKPTKKSTRAPPVETYKQEEDYYEDYEEAKPVSAPIPLVPTRKKPRDSAAATTPGPRRVRYVPPKSKVKIFEEKVDWSAESKVDAQNDEAMKAIRSASKKKIFEDQLVWKVRPKVDTYNDDYIENSRYPQEQPRIFVDQPVWYDAEAKVDTHNEYVVDQILRAPKPQIYDEKMKWKANRRIDSRNEEAMKRLRSAPKREIYDEKFSWPAETRIDNQNEEYLQYKERERATQHEKLLSRSVPPTPRVKVDHGRIVHQNPDFDEHKKQQKLAQLPPIEDRKLKWEQGPRINQRNDDYIERIRQKRSVPLIFREKLNWRTKTPRITARNEEFVEALKEPPPKKKIFNKQTHWKAERKIDAQNASYDPDFPNKPPVQIVNEKLRWRAEPKIDAFNEAYDPDSQLEPVPIVNEKLRWRAEPKIDAFNEAYDPDTPFEPVPIVNEKLRWHAQPKIDAHNDSYNPDSKNRSVQIVNQKLRWHAQPKIDAQNASYDPDSQGTSVQIVNEKLRWRARTRIDTGLEPDPNETEYANDGVTA